MKSKHPQAEKPTSSTESSDSDDPHHSPWKKDLLSHVQAFRELRDDESIRNLLATCRRHRFWYSCRQDQEDVIQDALLEALEAESIAPVTDEEFAANLLKALDKHIKRVVRRPETPVAPEKVDGSTPGHDVTLVTRESADRLLSALFRALEETLPLLRPRDRLFVVRCYELEEYFEPGDEVVVPITPEAERKALYRARRRLSSAMEEWLAKELRESPPESRDPLIEALEIVRGERYPEALAQLVDLIDRSAAL